MRNITMVKLRGDRTLRETAIQIGIPYSTYAMIEAGHRFPRRDLAIKIAKFYNKTVDELFFTLNDRVS